MPNDERERHRRASAGEFATSRRTVLTGATVGAVSLAGCTGLSSEDEGEDDEAMSWERAADERIEEHRTTDVTVRVEDGDGEPIDDARVEVAMREHEFGFGTAVNAEHLIEETEPGDEYRTHLTELFNKVVLENRHKWRFWETPDERDLAETATKWLLARGLEMRGHTCIWQRRGQGAIPDDIVEAMDEENRSPIERRTRGHITDIVGYYSDMPALTEWDVLNEQVDFHELTDLLDPGAPPTEPPRIANWFRVAERADPNAQLFINEYNIIVGDDEEHRDQFETIVRHLLAHDAPLEGVGIQGHHSSVDDRRSPEELLETLDRFVELVPAIQIHEYDTWGEEWTDEMEAEYLYEFLKTVYSHPAVQGFLMWGFWDEIHWQGNAPLFEEDWSRKPAYDVYTDLVFDEWWTEEEETTDSDGEYDLTAFLGEYEITAATDNETETTIETFDDPWTNPTVVIRIDGERSSD
ncbi:endo-1,4-beta-xylanase [Natronococcus pandeyae]|nr:endo-1,4-beta-xylanase [Natronococcus pandeyae]